MKIDLTDFLHHQTLEETIQVLDDMLLILVIHTEAHGLSPELSHQYTTLRNLRNTFQNRIKTLATTNL